MYSYVDIKKRENELLEKKDLLHKEREDIVSVLYNFKNKYPNLFRVLPENFNNVDPSKFGIRLEILKEDISNSSLDPKEKEEILEKIEQADSKIKIANNRERMYDKFLNESVLVEKEKRKEYLMQKKKEAKEIRDEYKKLEEIIELRQKLLEDENLELSIKNKVAEVIENYKREQKSLISKLKAMLEEKGLEEELNLLNEELGEIEKESTTLNSSEENKEDSKPEEPIQTPQGVIELPPASSQQENSFTIEEVEEEQPTLNGIEDSQPEEPQKGSQSSQGVIALPPASNQTEDVTEEELEPVVPEPPKKVREKHKASPELIKKIKKYGGATLGLLSLGAVITAVVLNWAAIGPILAGMGVGKFGIDMIKEHKSK